MTTACTSADLIGQCGLRRAFHFLQVATYNSAVQHAPGAVSHYEKSQQTSSWFDNTIRQTQNDVADLDLGEKQLSAALHDTKQTKAVDIAIRNVRERFGHRRV